MVADNCVSVQIDECSQCKLSDCADCGSVVGLIANIQDKISKVECGLADLMAFVAIHSEKRG